MIPLTRNTLVAAVFICPFLFKQSLAYAATTFQFTDATISQLFSSDSGGGDFAVFEDNISGTLLVDDTRVVIDIEPFDVVFRDPVTRDEIGTGLVKLPPFLIFVGEEQLSSSKIPKKKMRIWRASSGYFMHGGTFCQWRCRAPLFDQVRGD